MCTHLTRISCNSWQEKDEAYILKILPREVAYRLDVIDEMIRRIARLRAGKKGQI